ncbi:MAG TPA: TetR/AcrR family transcriptional regulator [Candidatus Limnocylindria bacterium]
MSSVPKPSRLSRERVLAAAIEIADRDGIDALTMRRLAEELGAGAMSVYYHVANKDDLLGGMVDLVVGEMELADGRPDWKEALKRTATSAHEVLLRHPWATALLLTGPGVSDARLRYMDAMLGCLRGAGFSPELTDLAYHALDSHIMGFTLWLVGISAGMERLGPISNVLDLFDPREFPHLAEHAQQHLRERQPGEQGAFEFGLDLVLDGLERRLSAAPGAAP